MFPKIAALCLSVLLAAETPLWAMARRPETPAQNAAPLKLTLQDCYLLALKRSETLAIQQEEIKIAEAQIFKATGEAIGDVDFVTTDTFKEVPSSGGGEGGIASTFNARERRERYFQISQPIFQGFKSIGALTGAGGLTAQRREEWKRAKHLLYLDVVQAFHQTLRLRKDVTSLQEIITLLKERVKDLTARAKIGRSRPGEVAMATARLKIHEANLERAKGAWNVSLFTLEFLTGEDLRLAELIDQPTPELSSDYTEDYPALAVERPDVKASDYAKKTAKRAVLVAQSGFWPVITLDHTQYEKREGFQSGIDWDLLFKVKVPLFRGGDTFGKFKESWSKYRQAKKNNERVERKAGLEIRESYQNWVSSVKEYKALEEAVQASKNNYELQKQDYAKNLVNNLEVLTALESLLTTSMDANRGFYDMKNHYWGLQVAAGNCCEETP